MFLDRNIKFCVYHSNIKLNAPSSFGKIGGIYNISIDAKRSVKLKDIVCKKIDPIEKNQLSGLYKMPFIKEDDTVQFYIGMTSRKYSIWLCFA